MPDTYRVNDMKKLILLLVSSLFLLSCSKRTATLPDDLGDFKLGMSMHSVVTMLNSKGLSELKLDVGVGMGDDEFPKYSYDISNSLHNTDMLIRFSSSSPYFYDKKKWEWIRLGFYQGVLYSVDFTTYYEGHSGIEECLNIYKEEELRLHSRYKKFEKEVNKGGDYANVTYENDNKELCLVFWEGEGLTSLVQIGLYNLEIGEKVQEEISTITTPTVEVAEEIY